MLKQEEAEQIQKRLRKFKTWIKTNINEKPLTTTKPREKTIGAKNTPLKEAAASALGLLRTTDPIKEANELSRQQNYLNSSNTGITSQ